MKLKYLYIGLGILFFILPEMGYAQEKQLIISSDMQYGYAQKLFSEKKYEMAMVEYHRLVHFFPESDHLEQVTFNIAVCLFHLKKYHDAARAFNDIIVKGKKEALIKEAVFYQSESFLKLGNTGYAQIGLQNYLMLTDDPETKDRIYFNLAKIYLAEAGKSKPGALKQAAGYLSKISGAGVDKYQVDQYADLIFQAENAPKKNPKTAGILSVIPGGGFLYCERYQDALVTFLLNGGLMLAAYTAWEDDNKALAGVIGFVETGFYTGNIYGAVSSAHKYNRNQVVNVLNKAFTISSKFDPEKKGYELSLTCGF